MPAKKVAKKVPPKKAVKSAKKAAKNREQIKTEYEERAWQIAAQIQKEEREWFKGMWP